ncbi:unnamed protein product, partial [Tetraodon nigroviridis]
MSIDTLLEAARYLEWQAQQQQITREEEQRKEKDLIHREAEAKRVELVTSLSQPMKVETAGQQLLGGKPGQSQPQVHIQYPTSISTSNPGSQHALAPHQAPPTSQSRPNGVTIEDMRGMEGKRRPGGAGTREVHNKLEKNRRAHLKECFETLKKNVPNVDEKKTSNLSVLRTALRYIQ